MAKAVEPSRPRSWLWLQGLLCGAAFSLLPGFSIVVTVLLAPAVLMGLLETTPKRPVATAMGLLAAATAILPLQSLWNAGGSVETALAVIASPLVVALSWTMSGGGWLLSEGAAVLSLQASLFIDRSKVTALRKERSFLEHEWGLLETAANPAP